jgi:hypothetical protein
VRSTSRSNFRSFFRESIGSSRGWWGAVTLISNEISFQPPHTRRAAQKDKEAVWPFLVLDDRTLASALTH